MSDTPDPALLRQLEDALRAMPKLQREILLARRLDDMPYREIARRTGLTMRQVERHVASAIRRLDKHLHGRKLSWWQRWF